MIRGILEAPPTSEVPLNADSGTQADSVASEVRSPRNSGHPESRDTMKAPDSRRDFLAAVAGMGATMVLRPSGAVAADDVDPRVAELVASTIGVDTHNHIDVPLTA